MWVEASHLSIPTSVGGHEDTSASLKWWVAVKTKHSHEEPASQAETAPNPCPHAHTNILFFPGWFPLLFIDLMVGIPELDLTIWKACWDDVQLQVLVILHTTDHRGHLGDVLESNSSELGEAGDKKNRERYNAEG